MSPERFRHATQSRVHFLFRHLQGSRVLDIGNLGGEASPHPVLQSRVMGTVVGLDIDLTKALSRRYPHQVVGMAQFLPFRNATFDTVYAGELIEHVWDPYAALLEMRRVLTFEGKLLIDTPNPFALERIVRWLIWGENSLGDADHKIFYLPGMLERLLTRAGFALTEMTTDDKITLGPLRLKPLPRWPLFARLGSHLCAAAVRTEELR